MRRASTWQGAAVSALWGLLGLSLCAEVASAQMAATPPAATPGTASGATTPGAAAAKPGAPGGIATSNAPVDITADESQLFNQERRQIWKGNVDAIQGTDRLRTPLLTVFYAQRGAPAPGAKPAKQSAAAPGSAGATFGKIERMEAEGPVYFTTPTQNARGDHGTYIAADDTITLIGNVVMMDQDKNVATGEKLVIEKSTGKSTLFAKNGAQQRVRGVFYQQPAPAPAPGAQPPAKAAVAHP